MIRVGFGIDVHRFVENRDLWIGGVKIPYELGLAGHSDADVLIHAICDALLGAANLRDIGYQFPDTSNEFLDIDSKILLRRTGELLVEKGLDIPVFGMVKDDFHKTRALCTENEEISIARVQDVFSLIYRIQEEVHRYTIGRMTQAKRKTVRTSSLTKIPGIGDAKAKKLLAAFGGLAALKKATREEIEAVSGISAKDAKSIIEYFKK